METQTTLQTNAPIQSTPDPFAQSLVQENKSMKKNKLFLPLAVVAIVLGLGTGVAGATLTGGSSGSPATQTQTPSGDGEDSTATEVANAIKVGQVVGAKDASAFKDSVEGVLVSGGIGSEGSHHIVRPGGESQNVYLTSSVMDLKLFEGARVKVSGETFKGQKAGWLMDVGRVEILELNAALPDGAKPAKTTGAGDF